MIDLKILEDAGITQESLKRKLSGDPRDFGKSPVDPAAPQDQQEKITALWNRIRSRVQEARDRNFADYKLYYALDQAWDTPFRQISPTLIGSLMDADPKSEEVTKQIQEWGLSNLLTQEMDAKTGLATGKKLFNLPIFFHVFVPLVRAYVTIRWAKIMNDLRLTPFHKFDAVKKTMPLRLKCEALTDRVQIMANQYGHYDVTKQAVLKMLHYSQCFQVPREEWHSESQWKFADQEDVAFEKKKEDGKPVSVGDKIKVTTREGLRYHFPHPTRVGYDLAYGPYTFNHDSGCEFFNYWRIARYRDVSGTDWWNKDKISLGTADLRTGNSFFFTSVYPTACALAVVAPAPTDPANPQSIANTVGTGTSSLDREKALVNQYYGTDHMDQGVLVTEHFEKLIPKDNGLGDYDGPVWFRFVLAGDGCTILYAAPLPYCPVLYYGYDADESRSKNASLSLEILPFQDQFTNVLSQVILTAKQNLANLTLVDEDQITEPTKTKLQGMGEGLYRTLNLFGFSGKKAFRGANKVAEAIQSFNLPKGNTAELINVLKTILDVLERVLVMSSHEVAQAASHEQTREEVKNIAASTSSRLTFTATPVGIAREAWKRQTYQALMAYGDDDMYAHIPSDTPLTKETLTSMGFTFVDKDNEVTASDRHHRARVKKQAIAMPLWEFSSMRDGEDRTNDREVAISMSQLVLNALNNPLTAQAIGPVQAIELFNQIAQKAGLDRDFKLRNMGPSTTPDQQKQEMQAQLKQLAEQVLQQVHQEMKVELAPLLNAVKSNSADIALLMRAVLGAGAPPPTPIAPDGLPAPGGGPPSPGGPPMASPPPNPVMAPAAPPANAPGYPEPVPA